MQLFLEVFSTVLHGAAILQQSSLLPFQLTRVCLFGSLLSAQLNVKLIEAVVQYTTRFFLRVLPLAIAIISQQCRYFLSTACNRTRCLALLGGALSVLYQPPLPSHRTQKRDRLAASGPSWSEETPFSSSTHF